MKASNDEPDFAFGPYCPPNNGHYCQCLLCRRTRRFYRIAAKLNERDQEWLLRFYDYVAHHLEANLKKLCATKRKPTP